MKNSVRLIPQIIENVNTICGSIEQINSIIFSSFDEQRRIGDVQLGERRLNPAILQQDSVQRNSAHVAVARILGAQAHQKTLVQHKRRKAQIIIERIPQPLHSSLAHLCSSHTSTN